MSLLTSNELVSKCPLAALAGPVHYGANDGGESDYAAADSSWDSELEQF